MKTNIYYMNEAIKEAKKADKINEIPVGAIVVDEEGNIIGRGYNKKETSYKTIAHAEIEAITKANIKKQNWRLMNCTMYVTLEPCEMCKKILSEAKINKIYYLLKNNSVKKEKVRQNKIKNNDQIIYYKKILNESFKRIR